MDKMSFVGDPQKTTNNLWLRIQSIRGKLYNRNTYNNYNAFFSSRNVTKVSDYIIHICHIVLLTGCDIDKSLRDKQIM